MPKKFVDRLERLRNFHEVPWRTIRRIAHSARIACIGYHSDQQMVTLDLGAHDAITCLRETAHRYTTTKLPYDTAVNTIPIVRHRRVSAKLD